MSHPLERDLNALAYGLVEGKEREELIEHIQACPECCAFHDECAEEAAIVGQAVLEDSGYGSAAAQSLDRALRRLEDAEAGRGGKVVAFPRRWVRLSEIAAGIAIVAGLVLVMNATIGLENQPNLGPTVPTQIINGTAFAVADSGDWNEVEVLPLNRPIRSGDGETLEIELLESRARVTLDDKGAFQLEKLKSGTVSLRWLAGSGRVETFSGASPMPVDSGVSLYLVDSGSRISLASDPLVDWSAASVRNRDMIPNVHWGKLIGGKAFVLGTSTTGIEMETLCGFMPDNVELQFDRGEPAVATARRLWDENRYETLGGFQPYKLALADFFESRESAGAGRSPVIRELVSGLGRGNGEGYVVFGEMLRVINLGRTGGSFIVEYKENGEVLFKGVVNSMADIDDRVTDEKVRKALKKIWKEVEKAPAPFRSNNNYRNTNTHTETHTHTETETKTEKK